MRAARTAEKEHRKAWREEQCWLNLDLVSIVLKGRAWTQGRGGHSPETGRKGGTASLQGRVKLPEVGTGDAGERLYVKAGSKPPGHSEGRAERCCDNQ